MSPPVQFLALALAGASLALTSCKSKSKPNFEAVLSLAPSIEGTVSEATLVSELQARVKLLSLTAEIDAGPTGDHRITVRLKAKDKTQALARMDALCETGSLSVRVVHNQTVYLSAAVRTDPSKLPAGHEIMTFRLQAGELSKSEDLVVATAEIVNSSHVKSAETEAGKEHLIHISLTTNGGHQMQAATEKMQKGRSRLAIIYDERIISAPVVVDELRAQFTLKGFNSFEEAQAIAASLNKPLSTELLLETLMPLAP
jgi:preprotein translocase subunit SecD